MNSSGTALIMRDKSDTQLLQAKMNCVAEWAHLVTIGLYICA